MFDTTNECEFAIGRTIKQVYTESILYLDGTYDENTYADLSIRRIDKPLYILLDNDLLVRLYGTSLSIACDYDREYVFGKDFIANAKAQKEFGKLCGLTISNVQNVYENKYDFEDEYECLDDFGNHRNPDDPTDLIVVFDNGLRLVCNMFFDYCDIQIAGILERY